MKERRVNWVERLGRRHQIPHRVCNICSSFLLSQFSEPDRNVRGSSVDLYVIDTISKLVYRDKDGGINGNSRTSHNVWTEDEGEDEIPIFSNNNDYRQGDRMEYYFSHSHHERWSAGLSNDGSTRRKSSELVLMVGIVHKCNCSTWWWMASLCSPSHKNPTRLCNFSIRQHYEGIPGVIFGRGRPVITRCLSNTVRK